VQSLLLSLSANRGGRKSPCRGKGSLPGGREESGKWKSQMTDKAESSLQHHRARESALLRARLASLSAGEFVKAFLPLSAKATHLLVVRHSSPVLKPRFPSEARRSLRPRYDSLIFRGYARVFAMRKDAEGKEESFIITAGSILISTGIAVMLFLAIRNGLTVKSHAFRRNGRYPVNIQYRKPRTQE